MGDVRFVERQQGYSTASSLHQAARRPWRFDATTEEYKALLAYSVTQQDNKCWYCKEEMSRSGAGINTATVEHLIPRSAGGKTNAMNCVAACYKCNHERGKPINAEGNLNGNELVSPQVPQCPDCGGMRLYRYKTRRIFKCADCSKQFSETSNGPLRARKIPLGRYKEFVGLLVQEREGFSFRALAMRLGMEWRTANTIYQKIHHAIRGKPMSDCDHKSLGKAPEGARIAACPDCGQVFFGMQKKWDATRVRVEPGAKDHNVFDAVVGHMLRPVK